MNHYDKQTLPSIQMHNHDPHPAPMFISNTTIKHQTLNTSVYSLAQSNNKSYSMYSTQYRGQNQLNQERRVNTNTHLIKIHLRQQFFTATTKIKLQIYAVKTTSKTCILKTVPNFEIYKRVQRPRLLGKEC